MKKNSELVIAALLLALLVITGRPVKPTPPVAISEGTIVLLKSGLTNAAFVPIKQSVDPEVVDYIWFCRNDGKSTFGTNDPACTMGVVTNAKSIAFGPFDIQWSTAGGACGYVYYPSRERSIKKPWGGYWAFTAPKPLGGPQMAVTFERDLTKVGMYPVAVTGNGRSRMISSPSLPSLPRSGPSSAAPGAG